MLTWSRASAAAPVGEKANGVMLGRARTRREPDAGPDRGANHDGRRSWHHEATPARTTGEKVRRCERAWVLCGERGRGHHE